MSITPEGIAALSAIDAARPIVATRDPSIIRKQVMLAAERVGDAHLIASHADAMESLILSEMLPASPIPGGSPVHVGALLLVAAGQSPDFVGFQDVDPDVLAEYLTRGAP